MKKLSGKNYPPDAVKNILENLGFDIINESVNELMVTVPYNKTDIKLPADLVEEIVRIDGLDNIEIPKAITITPATEKLALKENLKEKLSNYLIGLGFSEILTNSITNRNYYSEQETKHVVKMMNSLTAELNMLRPSMLETALESIAYNINRKNASLRFFEFGKTYSTEKTGIYKEEEHFSLYLTGSGHYDEWKKKSQPSDFFVAKGIASSLLKICGLNDIKFEEPIKEESGLGYTIKHNSVAIAKLVEVSPRRLKIFDIKQPVYFIDLNYETVLGLAKKREIIFTELGKFQPVFRDLAIIVDKWLPFSGLESTIKKLNLTKLGNTPF